jgi:hypothetical protein
MKSMTRASEIGAETLAPRGYTVDTTFVLFFLAVEFGQTLGRFSFDSLLFALALAVFIVLPYFLIPDGRQSFGSWLTGRTVIAVFAVIVGALYKQSLGVILPESFGYLPMTLLIITGMLSCYMQFYGLLRLRLAK